MTAQERFAQDWQMDVDRVGSLMRRADECMRLNEHACNGDPHPRNKNPEDKAKNAGLWQHALEVETADLERFAKQYGFTAIVYTGLRPTLKKDDRYIEIP